MLRRSMLFVREYRGMLGGHLKVFEYLEHVAVSKLFAPVLYLVPGSSDVGTHVPADVPRVAQPFAADAFFVAGNNWGMLDEAGIETAGKPVINLIQGFRHVLEGDSRREFLRRRALRICVSQPLYDAVIATGLANGPVVCVPNGLDHAYLARFAEISKAQRVFIAGIKDPEFALELRDELVRRGFDVDACREYTERDEFLRRLSACAIVVALPDPHEGFFLPPLEAMALGSAVVIPRCLGPNAFCIDRRTCLTTEYAVSAIATAVLELHEDRELAGRLVSVARASAATYSLERERAQFLEALRAYAMEYAA